MENKLENEVIQARIDFAREHYRPRNDLVDSILEVLKQDFPEVQADAGGHASKEGKSGYLDVVKPGRGQAIIQKYVSYFLHSSDIQLEVLPLRRAISKGEDQLCSDAEYFLRGLLEEASNESANTWLHSAVWWDLCGGMMTIKSLFFPQLRDTEEFPIKLFAPDTRAIYPIFANNSLLYIVEEYDRYVMDIKRELEHLQVSSGKKKVWTMPLFRDENGEDLKGTEKITITEYWDDQQCGVKVGGEWLWNKTHGYPCVPYALGFCLPTPLAEAEWKGRPILASSMDALKQEAYLQTKLSTGVETMFWPIVLAKSSTGRVIQVQTGPSMPITEVDPDSQLTILNPQPNVPLLREMLGHFVSEISRNTLPEVMWGQPRSPAISGYAEVIKFGGTETDLAYIADQISSCLARALSNVLRITEAFAGKVGFSVYSRKLGQDRHELVTMKDSDVGGHYQVRVKIRPLLDRDMLQKMQMARFMREPSRVTGEQLFPDQWILKEVFRVPDPVALQKARTLEAIYNHPLVKTYREEQALEDYRKEQGISKAKWDELKGAGQPPEGPPGGAPQAERLMLPIPVPMGQQMGQQAQMGPPEGPPGGGEMPWGLPPEMLPPEEGGMGRAQTMSPEEQAAMAAMITGRPPEGE